jgi:hypothetical protein
MPLQLCFANTARTQSVPPAFVDLLVVADV